MSIAPLIPINHRQEAQFRTTKLTAHETREWKQTNRDRAPSWKTSWPSTTWTSQRQRWNRSKDSISNKLNWRTGSKTRRILANSGSSYGEKRSRGSPSDELRSVEPIGSRGRRNRRGKSIRRKQTAREGERTRGRVRWGWRVAAIYYGLSCEAFTAKPLELRLYCVYSSFSNTFFK